MITGNQRDPASTTAMLVAVQPPEQDDAAAAETVRELGQLTATFGATVGGQVVLKLSHPNPRFFVGSGQAEEVVRQARAAAAGLIVFDEDLSPAQQRNWEVLAGMPVVDRRGLILEIFAARASTREAVLQVQLAQAEYLLPRLKRAWTHLSRQEGRPGLRGGEGEMQLELDARLLGRRITRLRQELKTVRKRRAEQRKRRRTVPVVTGAIVGYTNAGKSSLLNRLTDADVFVEDKLFATLDPTTRRLRLPNHQVLLLTDTVGFVRKLPHPLVEAFRATLEEACLADFLILVVDAASAAAQEHLQTTEQVLAEIGAGDRRTLVVFNKTDLVEDRQVLRRLRLQNPAAVFISVHTGEGLPDLLARLTELVGNDSVELRLRIPQDQYAQVAWLHRTGTVVSERYEGQMVYVTAQVPRRQQAALDPYLVADEDDEPVVTAAVGTRPGPSRGEAK